MIGWQFNTIAKNRTQLAAYTPACKDLLGYRPRPTTGLPGKASAGRKKCSVSLHLFHSSK